MRTRKKQSFRRVMVAALTLLAMASGCAVRPVSAEPTPLPAAKPTPTPIETLLPAKASHYPDNRETLEMRLVKKESTLTELQQDVKDGLYSYEDLTRFCLDRIAENAAANAVLSVARDAVALAARCDRNPGGGSLLYGIPVIVSDSIDVAGTAATGGMTLLRDRVPTEDAFLVEMIKAAGAIPVAKANLDELNGFVIGYADGQHGSSLGGRPTSPYGVDPGGAEFGCAISVAMGLAPLAVGIDTRGSLLSPAFSNSVVAIRPSHALVSRTGVIPACSAYDVAGPVARNVRDAAYLLYAMQGADVNDPDQEEGYQPIREPNEFLPKDCAGALAGLRIYLGTGADTLPDEAQTALKNAGALLVSGLDYAPYEDDPTMSVLGETPYRYGVRDSINGFLSRAAVGDVTSIPRLVTYNETHADAVPFGQDRLLSLALLPPMDYTSVGTVDRYLSEHSLNSFMEEHSLDLILSADAAIATSGNLPLNPSVSLPMGTVTADGKTLLTSAVLTAREGRDETAIAAAYVMETLLGSRRVQPAA